MLYFACNYDLSIVSLVTAFVACMDNYKQDFIPMQSGVQAYSIARSILVIRHNKFIGLYI